MSASPPPPTMLACQRDPEGWFDRRNRRDALAQCLVCPARPECAREALSWQADWGMWAGVWIDGCHNDAAPYLNAIANDDGTPTDWRPPLVAPEGHPSAPAPLHRPPAAAPARSALLARSCGHCEVFAEGCRYSFDRVMNRRPAASAAENDCLTSVFAACGTCADIVARLAPQLAIRSGYLVMAGRDPASVPFLWRGSRWVLLDRQGWLTEIGDDARSA
jgi:Transcription factor WhiB